MTVKLNECANRKPMNRVVIYSAHQHLSFGSILIKIVSSRASLNQKKPMKFNIL